MNDVRPGKLGVVERVDGKGDFESRFLSGQFRPILDSPIGLSARILVRGADTRGSTAMATRTFPFTPSQIRSL